MDKQDGQMKLNPQILLDLMRKTKKTDPIFKVLKKLKTAIQTIGYSHFSLAPTSCIAVFHFGLGSDYDRQIIAQTNPPQYSPILPGKSYCFLNFQSSNSATKYLQQQFFRSVLQNIPTVKYTLLSKQKHERILICLFCEGNFGKEISQNLPNTNSKFQPHQIPGLQVVEQFLNQEEQKNLFQQIDKGKWEKLNNRRVQHYGFQFKYGLNLIDKDQQYDKQMPQFCVPLLKKMYALKLVPYYFDQLTINDYFPGDGIPPHFDTHSPFEEIFVAISILSGIVMEFRKYDGHDQSVYLKRRSLIIFSGEGRYAWTHGISCRKMDKVDNMMQMRERRISLTFRKIKLTPCQCPYYFFCDSQGYDQSTMKKNNPLLKKYQFQTVQKQKLAKTSKLQLYHKYVLNAYDGIGCSFHNKIIKGVEDLAKSAPAQLVLDLGCGNGEYKSIFEDNYYIGVEVCEVMEQFEGKVLMSGLQLGFRDDIFDLVLSVAVLHHMPTHELRLKMLSEMWRVLNKQKGRLVISVFSWQAKKDVYENQCDILLEYCVPKHKFESKKQEKEKNSVRSSQKGQVYERYYHLFQQNQLKQLLQLTNFEILKILKEGENILMLAKCKNI